MRDTDVRTVTVHGSAAGFAQAISIGQHRLVADEPVIVGGTDTGPNPYDLLLAALGSCTSMTVAMYARRKEWPLEAVTVRLRHSRVHAADCERPRRAWVCSTTSIANWNSAARSATSSARVCWTSRTSARSTARSRRRSSSRRAWREALPDSTEDLSFTTSSVVNPVQRTTKRFHYSPRRGHSLQTKRLPILRVASSASAVSGHRMGGHGAASGTDVTFAAACGRTTDGGALVIDTDNAAQPQLARPLDSAPWDGHLVRPRR